MTDELLEKAGKLKSAVLQAESFITRLKNVDIESGCFIRFGDDNRHIYIPEELAKHVINDLIDFYNEKLEICSKKFNEL